MMRSVGLYPPSGRGGVAVVLAVLGALALGAVTATSSCDAAVVAAARNLAAGCALAILATGYVLSRRVVADATGLQVHGLLGSRSIPWSAILLAEYEPARALRRARLGVLTADGTVYLPPDASLGERIRGHVPDRARGLDALPSADAQQRRATGRGLEMWMVALQAGALASLASTLLPTLESRLLVGAVVLVLASAWLLGLRRGPWLLRGWMGLEEGGRVVPGTSAPGALARGAAALGENAVALVLLVIGTNVILGAAARSGVPRGALEVPVLAGAALPVRSFIVRGRDLALPAALAAGCEERDGGLTCDRSDGWIIVDRDESAEGLLGGEVLRRSVLFRRDDLRLDALPHETLRWYVAGMLARTLAGDPPQGLVERPDGEVSVFWRRRRGVQALVASGGEMLTVDVRGAAGSDATLLPLLGSLTAHGSDLTCRWAEAVVRLGETNEGAAR